MDDALATSDAEPNADSIFSTIVVGTDGSDAAKIALRRAATLADAHAAELHIVVAYDPRLTAEFAKAAKALKEQSWRASPGEHAEQVAQEAAGSAAAAGVSVETHVEVGDPAISLIEVAEAVDAQLIVVGSKGLADIGRFLLGSVPSKVAQHAHCDVLIVRNT